MKRTLIFFLMFISILTSYAQISSNEDAFSLSNNAYIEAEAGNYDKAIKLSEMASAMYTDKQLRAMLYDNIAFAYYHSGQQNLAIAALNSALGEDIMYQQVAYNLGVYQFEMGLITKALWAFDLFIQRHKDSGDKELLAAAYAYKGDCHSKNGQIKDAEEAYKQSLSSFKRAYRLF